MNEVWIYQDDEAAPVWKSGLPVKQCGCRNRIGLRYSGAINR